MDSLTKQDYVKYTSWTLYVISVILILVALYLWSLGSYKATLFVGLTGLIVGFGTFYGMPHVSKWVGEKEKGM